MMNKHTHPHMAMHVRSDVFPVFSGMGMCGSHNDPAQVRAAYAEHLAVRATVAKGIARPGKPAPNSAGHKHRERKLALVEAMMGNGRPIETATSDHRERMLALAEVGTRRAPMKKTKRTTP